VIELTLPDMTCNHCVRTVTETVRKLDPAARLDFELPTHKVRIESTRPVEEISSALAEEGYPPKG